jgi:hypothetical protein
MKRNKTQPSKINAMDVFEFLATASPLVLMMAEQLCRLRQIADVTGTKLTPVNIHKLRVKAEAEARKARRKK